MNTFDRIITFCNIFLLLAVILVLLMLWLEGPCEAQVLPGYSITRMLAPTNVVGDILPGSAEVTIGGLQRQLGKTKKLIIDTNGGVLEEVELILRYMEWERQVLGTKFSCLVRDKAYSAGFWLFLHCDERYMLSGAQVMWHLFTYVITGVISPLEMYKLGAIGLQDQAIMNLEVERRLRVPFSAIRYLYDTEMRIPANQLVVLAPGFTSVISDVEEWQ